MRTEPQIAHMLDTAKTLSNEAQYQLLAAFDADDIALADDIASGTRIAEGHGETPLELGSRVVCDSCGEVESGNPSLAPAFHPSILAG